MVEFLKLIELEEVVDTLNGVCHALHDIERAFPGGDMPGLYDLKKTGFIDTGYVAFDNKFPELFFTL
jgi:hypothetical protein